MNENPEGEPSGFFFARTLGRAYAIEMVRCSFGRSGQSHAALAIPLAALVCLTTTLGCSEGDSADDAGGGGETSGSGGETSGGGSGGSDPGGAVGGFGGAPHDVEGFGEATGAALQGTLDCAPQASQAFVYGDSIPACFGVAAGECAVSLLEAHLGSAIPLTSEAVGGSVTDEIAAEILDSTPEAGHALVLIQVGGNDLAEFMWVSDEELATEFPAALAAMRVEWEERILPALDATFVDGYSLIISTQYTPFDGCTASPYGISMAKHDAVIAANEQLISIAEAHEDVAMVANPFPAWLGHGHHFDEPACPNTVDGASGWMGDLIHPNATGHGYLGRLWSDAADALHRACP